MAIPHNHPRRIELNDEVHARPPEALTPPKKLSYLALLCNAAQREEAWSLVTELARRFDIVVNRLPLGRFTTARTSARSV